MAISTLDLNGNATGTDATTTFNEQQAVQLFSNATITSTGGTAGRVDSIRITLQGARATESLALDATGLSTATANGVSFSYESVTGIFTLTGTKRPMRPGKAFSATSCTTIRAIRLLS
jgi:hypothetical protein